jgi:hypothetical protein
MLRITTTEQAANLLCLQFYENKEGAKILNPKIN